MSTTRSGSQRLIVRRWPWLTGVPLISPLLVGAVTVMPSLLHAQTWATQAAVRVDVAATNNGNLAPSGQERKDLITSIQPTFQISGTGPRLRLNALLGVDLLTYAKDSEPDRLSPRVLGDLNATLAERLLFFDASVDVQQTELDPFGSRAGADSTQNSRLSSSYRLSPYIGYEISPQSKLIARYEAIVSRTDAEDLTDQRFTRAMIRAERQPLPVGGSLELSKRENRYLSNASSDWSNESFKATGDVAVGGEWVIGPIVGREHTTLYLQESTEYIYGAHAQWVPNPRTQLLADVEHRFFGTGWDLNFRHRTPLASFELQWSRLPVTTTTSLGVVPAGVNLSSFLNSILTTQQPDPVARGVLVSNLIANRGLPTELPGPIEIAADYAQLQTRVGATWVLLGSRNTISLTMYQETLTQLTLNGDPVSAIVGAASDSRQTGLTLNLNRRLAPQLALDLTATLSRISGLADRSGDESDEQDYRFALTRTLAPHTAVSAGLQYKKFNTNVAGIDSYTAAEGFIGLNHRF